MTQLLLGLPRLPRKCLLTFMSLPRAGDPPFPPLLCIPCFASFFPWGHIGFLPPSNHCISQSCFHVDLSFPPNTRGSASSSLFVPSVTSLSSPAAPLLPTIRNEFPFPTLGMTLSTSAQSATSGLFPIPSLGLRFLLVAYVIPHTHEIP